MDNMHAGQREEDEQRKAKVLGQVYKLVIRRTKERQAEEVDISAYTQAWVYDERTRTWTCENAPYRAIIELVSTGIFWWWQGQIEQQGRLRRWSLRFRDIQQALDWAEQELLTLQHETEEKSELPTPAWAKRPHRTLADFYPDKWPDLAPYWIDPQQLEPGRITYRVVIHLDYEPDDYETLRLSSGDPLRYNEKFATPTRLARELGLDLARVSITQPLGRDHGWYYILSAATYYQESLAADQAQRLWEESAIAEQHKAGKVIRAQYGYEEAETRYATMLGAYEAPNRPYPPLSNREVYMAEQAFRQTLIYALDVEGFREHLRLPSEYIRDEDLLADLHELRSESPHIPQEARRESQQWLAVRQRKTGKRLAT